MSKPRLQIIRGLPGSGKSTLAADRYPHIMRVETDMFFTTGGKYVFTSARNREAVRWFRDTVCMFCAEKMDCVVTGVFASHTERLDQVVETAMMNGYEVFIKTLATNFGSVHKVPEATLDAMRGEFATDEELRDRYGDRVEFGLMPPELVVEDGDEGSRCD